MRPNYTKTMAKEKVETPDTEREARWDAFLARHEKQNPAKHAVKKAAGEFDKIPDSFA